MAWRARTMFLSGLVSVLSVGAVQLLGADGQAATATKASETPVGVPTFHEIVPHPIDSLAGQWVYNAEESINIATGRPEQSPRSATQRAPGRGRTPYAGGLPGVGPGAGRAAGVSSSDQPPARPPSALFAPGEIGPTLAMMQESRSLRRDLMEVPEALRINVIEPDQAVTITDDLDRSRTYPLDGVKQKYQLGAARFSASTEWKDSQLRKNIEAADGFRMSETYFLSADGKRLFVIVRLGEPKKGAPLVGVNRVYDRVDE